MNQRLNIIKILFIILWLILSSSIVYRQVFNLIQYFPRILFLTNEQKNDLIDDGYYQFMKDCAREIHKDSDVVFILSREPEFGSGEWVQAEYFIQKAPYYLYPRMVFRKTDNRLTDYIIVYDLDRHIFYLNNPSAKK